LLNRVPGTRFDVVNGALTSPAQHLLVSDLEKSKPRLVVYTDTTLEFGLPVMDEYDGVYMYDMVQNYVVSQYLLDHYRPLVSIQGQLLMLRDDLVGRVPPLPHLRVPPETTDLYYQTNACAWGYTPNFLDPPTFAHQQRSLRLGIVNEGSAPETLAGWAVDNATSTPAVGVVAVRNGHEIAEAKPALSRPDVVTALGSPKALESGFSLSVSPGTGQLSLFALNSDGTASPIAGEGVSAPTPLPSSIALSNGEQVTVIPGRDSGHVDSALVLSQRTLELSVPPHADLSRFQWITVDTSGGNGHQQFALGNAVGVPGHEITWWTLPRGGTRISVQVGSCLQWHGFGDSPLYLAIHGSGTVRSVTLTT
jgi:hypothetical protein